MAIQSGSYLGGFSGKLGPAVGYMWNGLWCLRSRPGQVRNPRTEAQQAHREQFKQQVQLAASMRRVVLTGLTVAARGLHMTAQNLFVHLNQPAFGEAEGRLTVEWEQLRLSTGPVAPVAFGVPEVREGNVLSITFERNPLHVRADQYDEVHLYVHCPETGEGYLTAPAYRREGRVSAVLPEGMAGREVYLYGFVTDREGRASETLYIGHGPLTETALPQTADVQEAEQANGEGGISNGNGELHEFNEATQDNCERITRKLSRQTIT